MKNKIKTLLAIVITMASLSYAANALTGEANVLGVNVDPLAERQYRISMTLSHADTGWDHYANAWQVLNKNGEVIGERVLQHSYVNE